MKKISVAFWLQVQVFVSILFITYPVYAQLKPGSRGEEVKILQEILKTNPEIYPEGYVTGYFGPLTERAVKKLQERCGLSATGIVDEATQKCIYPNDYRIRVITPNGGEVWYKNETQIIRWEWITAQGIGPQKVQERIPFSPMVSIDLWRKISVPCPLCIERLYCPPCIPTRTIFVKHIATTNLYQGHYPWTIASDIPNGSDYIIRISLGPTIFSGGIKSPAPTEAETVPLKPIEPQSPESGFSSNWDESDGTFTIAENPQPAPPCVCPTCPSLSEAIRILENIISELQKVIRLLKL